jgi:hypothetical protein
MEVISTINSAGLKKAGIAYPHLSKWRAIASLGPSYIKCPDDNRITLSNRFQISDLGACIDMTTVIPPAAKSFNSCTTWSAVAASRPSSVIPRRSLTPLEPAYLLSVHHKKN